MARSPTRRLRAHHYLPRELTPENDIKIDSVSVKTVIRSAEFTRAVCPEIGFFNIILDNNNEEFSGKYSGEETVEFFIDYANGNTRQFKGQIDKVFPRYDSGKGFTLEVSGNHLSGELLSDIKVTESYIGNTVVSDIFDELNTTYLIGYTVNYTATDNTTKPVINWDEKPFWECVFDLIKQINADAYVDDDKVIQVFDKGSRFAPDTEAIIWNDTMIGAPEGLGTQSLTKRDKITTYGEAGGLPVISTSGTGTKREVIFDSKINTVEMAVEFGLAELNLKNQTPTEGKVNAFMLAKISPGDMTFISNPNFKVNGFFPIYKYTQKFPNERTQVFIQTSREIPHIFKKRIENELALQIITNPFRMTSSWNFVFDSENEITTKDSNVKIEDSIIKLSSGSEGTFTANNAVTTEITKVHLKVVGSALVGTIYKFSTDGGETITNLTPESDITVPSGTSLWLKVEFNNIETEIDALVILSR